MKNTGEVPERGQIQMKILMLAWEYPPRVVGGIAKVVYDLSQKLTREGHEVHVVTYLEGNVKEYEKDKQVHVHRVANYMVNPNNFVDWIMQLNFNMIAKSNALMDEGVKFDVIHAHDWLVAYAAKTLKNSYNIPLVATIHATENGRNGGIHNETQRYINDVEWLLTYEASEIICNSNFMKCELQRIFSLPFDKINIIPNGVNLTKFNGIQRDYDFRRKYAFDNEKIIFFAGRLVPEKGVQVLIDALPKMLEYYRDCKLVIAGRGPMLEELQSKVNFMKLSEKVYFTGYLNEKQMIQMYKSADVAVFPSTYEPFGIVALEGMLSGTPVVVSDMGGLNEIVEHGVDGLKSYAGNANSLADSILSLLYNQKLCLELVKNAKAKVKKHYSWQKIMEETFFVYEKAICQSVAQKQAYQIEQQTAEDRKKKNKNDDITNLLNFRQIYA